jgi:hypothetical protein
MKAALIGTGLGGRHPAFWSTRFAMYGGPNSVRRRHVSRRSIRA